MSRKPPSARVALISGAGGDIGQATARRLTALGVGVGVADVDPLLVDRLASDLASKSHDALAIALDATNPTQVEQTIMRVLNHFGRLDILVNATGGWIRGRSVQTLSVEDWSAGLASNLTSSFLCSKAAIPQLIKAGGGRIINVGSELARAAIPSASPDYVAGKAGLLALTQYLAVELAPHEITVNAVVPGTAGPDDVAELIAFIASDEARRITGSIFDISGDPR